MHVVAVHVAALEVAIAGRRIEAVAAVEDAAVVEDQQIAGRKQRPQHERGLDRERGEGAQRGVGGGDVGVGDVRHRAQPVQEADLADATGLVDIEDRCRPAVVVVGRAVRVDPVDAHQVVERSAVVLPEHLCHRVPVDDHAVTIGAGVRPAMQQLKARRQLARRQIGVWRERVRGVGDRVGIGLRADLEQTSKARLADHADARRDARHGLVVGRQGMQAGDARAAQGLEQRLQHTIIGQHAAPVEHRQRRHDRCVPRHRRGDVVVDAPCPGGHCSQPTLVEARRRYGRRRRPLDRQVAVSIDRDAHRSHIGVDGVDIDEPLARHGVDHTFADRALGQEQMMEAVDEAAGPRDRDERLVIGNGRDR